ncbi:GNAT family N-acetyltransferase [Candidatus Peregrinibacteria bacterium]|nr:GNAT family N-acetyltransferase [Candidatus Peregrinibacteria bacterium]MBT7736862.1 GNAT family N-acetyltransferase [Candidatus Peregrinibacteria bacterium]
MGIKYVSGRDAEEIDESDFDQVSDDLVKSLFSGLDSDNVKLKGKGPEDIRKSVVADVMQMIKNSHIVLALDDEKVVGMEGYKVVNITEDGRPVIELSHVVVDADYRRQDVSTHMYSKLLSEVLLSCPNCIIVATSRDQVFQNFARNRGYKMESLQKAFDLMGRKDGPEYVQSMEGIGFKGLVFDPKSPSKFGSVDGYFEPPAFYPTYR